MLKINGKNVVKDHFPNNERGYFNVIDYRNIYIANTYEFYLVYESNEDLFNLLLLHRAIKDQIGKKAYMSLHIKYFPYELMDREIPQRLFSLKYVAQLINECEFDNIIVYDAHSNVLPALLNHCAVVYPINTFIDNNQYDLYFYPDNGAAKKYSEIVNHPYRFGNKKRNLETGEIICYEVIADKEDIQDKKILIVDDLVMGGRTFCEAAKALREMGAKQIDVFVTHLMPQARDFYNTKGNGTIDNIYSVDTLDLIDTFKTPIPRP